MNYRIVKKTQLDNTWFEIQCNIRGMFFGEFWITEDEFSTLEEAREELKRIKSDVVVEVIE